MADFPDRLILHVDLDAFYAAVEELDDPSLAGQPVVVGAGPTGGHARGVVCTAKDRPRRFGARSAQLLAQAYRACPHAVFRVPRMQRYSEIAGRVFAIYETFTDCVEPLSIDEAFLDLSSTRHLFGTPV